MSQQLPISSIEFPAQDLDPEQVSKIAESLREKGQIHPVSVRSENGKYYLCSGIKRVAAALLLGWETILVEDKGEISSDEGRELSLHENLKRANLPWYEESSLVEELHALRLKQHGQSPSHRPTDGVKQGWSTRDTAEELGKALGSVSEDINLARAVKSDPSLRNVKDKKTAIRLVRLASKRYNREEEALSPLAFAPDDVYLGSSASILSRFEPNSFDACITDPPWLKFIEARLTRDDETVPVFEQVYRVLKNDSFLYVVVGIDDLVFYTAHLPKLGFTVSKTPLIWIKSGGMSRTGVRPWEYGRDFEFILLAVKGNPPLVRSTQQSSIKQFKVVPTRSLVHPHEKPVELIEDLIKDCTYEGATILEPFGGSGVLGEACRNTKRHFAIIERDKVFYDQIRRRLDLEK